jgi:predicted acyltransferase
MTRKNNQQLILVGIVCIIFGWGWYWVVMKYPVLESVQGIVATVVLLLLFVNRNKM